jgi:DNA-binding PadR family transcriptional regulator
MPKTKTYLTPAEYAILGLVRRKPTYGYELQRHLGGSRGSAVSAGRPAMVYAILEVLVRTQADRRPGQ